MNYRRSASSSPHWRRPSYILSLEHRTIFAACLILCAFFDDDRSHSASIYVYASGYPGGTLEKEMRVGEALPSLICLSIFSLWPASSNARRNKTQRPHFLLQLMNFRRSTQCVLRCAVNIRRQVSQTGILVVVWITIGRIAVRIWRFSLFDVPACRLRCSRMHVMGLGEVKFWKFPSSLWHVYSRTNSPPILSQDLRHYNIISYAIFRTLIVSFSCHHESELLR